MSRLREGAPDFTRPYNLKVGPIALTLNAGLGIEFQDNINLTSKNTQSDLILRPYLGMSGVWQVTKLNSLEMRTTLGYTKYLEHSDLDTENLTIAPDSAIRLNIFIGDIKLVLHERFSLEEDPITEGGVSGVAKLGRFTNTVGATALWDMNDVIWSLGYDHYDFITTGNTANTNGDADQNLSSLDHSTEQLSTAFVFKLAPTTNVGIEGTASLSQYRHNPNGDSTMFMIGPFLDMQLTRYTHLNFSGGYQLYNSDDDNNAPTPEVLSSSGVSGFSTVPRSSSHRSNGDGAGYYFSVALTHRLNRPYSDRLSVSRELQIGLLADRTETFTISYTGNWAMNRRMSLTSYLFYENVHETGQGAGSYGTSQLPDYQRFGATISTSFQLTKKMNVGINYQFTKQLSDISTLDYTQNRVSLQFGYQF